MNENQYRGVAQWPSFQLEDELVRAHGSQLDYVAGVDEVGTGALAGPVVAGAVVLQVKETDWYRELDDSKKLNASARQRLSELVRRHSVAHGVGAVSVAELDALGMVKARALAMRRALETMRRESPRLVEARLGVIVDGKTLRSRDAAGGLPALYTDRADAKSLSVAAASIVAKVYRDGLMRELARTVPGYGLERNVGYPSPEHRSALNRLGPSAEHRRSFGPVRAAQRVLARRG